MTGTLKAVAYIIQIGSSCDHSGLTDTIARCFHDRLSRNGVFREARDEVVADVKRDHGTAKLAHLFVEHTTKKNA
jgi:hypothetical protein